MMEYLLHDPKTNTYKLYHSFERLCRFHGIDKEQVSKDMLPVLTSKGIIIALTPDTKL
jgi:hypothetical protein